jgi:hypothetical protein
MNLSCFAARNTELSKWTGNKIMNNIMSKSKKYLVSLVIGAIALSLSSCSSTPTYPSSDSKTPATPSPSALSQTPSMAKLRAKSSISGQSIRKAPSTSNAVASNTITVTLFTSDTQCQALIPKQVSVPANQPVAAAVAKILEQGETGDFSLSEYRVKVNNGVATVDLQISPDSQRQLTSLSSCEQFALFGSLRKTLTSNSQWKIKDVRFTQRGEEILL